ncbi:protein translocase subunit SecF [Rivibacter subsaxonicus]|uniref:Protein-export membrane protein SecF n=1 Tax=Rivibacter subsaxonicus TaxID=457575 RepID=A0A4Q7VVI2_9BURK|nr:protein translocase subunit SecF [Rivibacter subsaxonicus]RZU00593.1 protein translocase subunit secF [Rivibacter subsaxonicus]
MEFFRIKRDIPFMKNALILNAISFITFAAAVFFLVTRGLHLSIEFTGGTVVEVQYAQAADIGKTRSAVEALGFGEVQVQKFGSSRDVLIRLPLRGEAKQGDVVGQVFGALCKAEGGVVQQRDVVSDKGESISKQVCEAAPAAGAAANGSEPVALMRSEFVGPTVGEELARDGAYALLATVIGIMAYLAFRFEWKFAVAGIVANLHDVIIILGFFAFFQWEFSLSVLAAVLAVLGYSVNESVVIFDRIRETFRKQRKMTTPQVIDHAITSTISRTIITHGSTQAMVLSMLIFGGPTLHYFAIALTIGILFGIYSSVFVAAAIAMWLGVKREDLVKGSVVKAEGDPDDPNAGAVV